MRRLFFTILVCIAISLVALSHWYVADRLFVRPGLEAANLRVNAGLLGLLGLLMVVQPIVERTLPRKISIWINWPAYIWMGVGFLFVVFLGFFDLLALLAATVFSQSSPVWEYLSFHHRANGAFIIVSIVSALSLRSGLRFPTLVRHRVALDRWPQGLKGFKVLQINDIHIGPMYGARYAKKLARVVNEEKPDLIAVVGDVIDGTVRKVGATVDPLANLRAKHGVYYVTGNHEHYYHPQQWCEKFASLGWRVLRNESDLIQTDGGSFYVAGCFDYRGALDDCSEDQQKALGGRKENIPTIFLAHDPSSFHKAKTFDVDFQLSGHTHGGQIWPFHYLVRLAIKYVAGFYKEERSLLYVSRGTGFWGPPMRFLAPQEITLHEIHPGT